MGRKGVQPKFFKGYGDLDPIGRLGGVEMYVGGSARGRHGGDLVGQLVGSTEHICAMSGRKGKNEKQIGAIAEWNTNGLSMFSISKHHVPHTFCRAGRDDFICRRRVSSQASSLTGLSVNLGSEDTLKPDCPRRPGDRI